MESVINFGVFKIFNIVNNQNFQATGAKFDSIINHKNDEYREKYIKMLEAEVERLKK
jgi:hypothetical protein